MHSIFSVPKDYIEQVQLFLESSNIPYELVKNLQTDEVDVNFLRKVVPFLMTAFKKYLKISKQGCQDQQQLKQNHIILTILQNHLKNKNANNSKIEISDLCYLISKKPKKQLFKSLLQKFLESDYLKEYIENNRRIKEERTKMRYSNILQRVQWELQCRQPFKKFLSQKHSINSQPQSPVHQFQEEDLNFQTDSQNI